MAFLTYFSVAQLVGQVKNGSYTLVVAPDEYPGKRYRGKYCYEHHLVYWQNTGVVPKNGEVVHHINEDKRDNKFENLELKTEGRHNGDHGHARKREVWLKCPTCNKDVLARRPSKVQQFCSRKCIGVLIHRGHEHSRKV